jgi:hypothetical protein
MRVSDSKSNNFLGLICPLGGLTQEGEGTSVGAGLAGAPIKGWTTPQHFV